MDESVFVCDTASIDMSLFVNNGKKVVVRCPDRQSSLMFLKAMIEVYPGRCRNWINNPRACWDDVEDCTHIDYYPCEEFDNLSWDSANYAERHGYTIIDFYDIVIQADLGEISVCESALDSLFS